MSARRLTATAGLLAMLILHPEAQEQQPIFRSSTTVVEVTVIVRDKSGAFVRGLGSADFSITEDGRPQRIESVYLAERPDLSGARSSDATPAGRTFVFLFDLDQLSPGSLTRAREAVRAFTSGRLTASDTSGVITAGLANAVSINNDHAATARAAAAVRPRNERLNRDRELREWPRILSPMEAADIARNAADVLIKARDRACQERDLDCTDSIPGRANREHAELELQRKARSYVAESRVSAEETFALLSGTAKALEGIRGRKTLIWFTEGSWSEEMTTRARQTAERASQSGVVVYAVDPRGTGRTMERAIDASAPEEVGTAFLEELSDVSSLMAAGTGGRFIRNDSRIDRVLRDIEEDTSTYYVIAYASDRASFGSGRPVNVTLARPGLQARLRHGFMAPQHGKAVIAAHAAPIDASTVAAFAGAAIGEPILPPRADHVERVRPNVESATRPADGSLAARAWSAYQRGDLEEARGLFEQAAASASPPAWSLHALGFTYMAANDSKRAVEAWERARRVAPGYRDLYLDLAAVYTQLSDVTSALAVLRDAEKRWPGDADVHNGVGVLMVRRGALNEAIDAFRRAAAASPGDALTHLNLGRAYELRYQRNVRFLSREKVWMVPRADVEKALDSFARVVAIGGPHAQAAAEAISRLEWAKQAK